LRSPSARQNLGTTDQHARIDTQPIAHKGEHDDGADSEAASTSGDAKTCTTVFAPPIFNLVAARQFIETHFPLSHSRTFAWSVARLSVRRLIHAADAAISAIDGAPKRTRKASQVREARMECASELLTNSKVIFANQKRNDL
jgi:hypothetical protein